MNRNSDSLTACYLFTKRHTEKVCDWQMNVMEHSADKAPEIPISRLVESKNRVKKERIIEFQSSVSQMLQINAIPQ